MVFYIPNIYGGVSKSMKQSKKLLSMILAIIMVFSSVSIVASARADWLDDAISYNSIDSAELTPEQYATAALDEVDRMLGKEQIVLTQDDIMVGELNLTSIDNALDSVNTILNGSLWTQFKGLLGDLSKLNISALTERRRSSTDTAVINSLLKFLYDNSSELLVPFIKGELDMGAIVAQFVPDINDLSVPDMLKEMLYKLAYPGQVVPSPVNVTVDKMVQDLINSTVAKEFPTFASYTDLLDLSAGSTYNSIDLGLKAIYNAWVVKKANQVWLPDLEKELMTNHADEVAKYKRYFNLNADGSFNFTIPQYTFTTDTFFSQLNNIIGSIVNAVLAPDLGFSWELGDNDMIVSNIINIGIEVLAATGDEFFASYVEVKTPEELDAMTDMEIVAYVARTIINSSIDGVWVPETADNLIKVANYTIKDIMAVNLPERDYSSNSAYPVDQINTIYKMLADFGVKALNDNPGLGLSYGIGVDELGKQALAWVIDEWGGLLSGITLNKNDSVWNNVDKLLKVILDNYSWFDATQFPSGTVTFESLVKDVLVSNILNLDFTPIFNLLANQPAGSELHKSPKEVLLRLVARTANLVFPGFIPTVTTFEALVTKNTLGNMAGALFTDLYSYRNTLVPAVVPIVCTALGLTTDQKFKTPDFDLEDFYYTSTANIDFKITNRSSGINTAYTDRNGVQHRDSRYSIKLESITCPDFTIGNISNPILKGGESTTVKITGAVTGAKNTIVTVTYNVLTEDGSNLTSSPLTARIYTCISKSNTDEQTEWTTTSGTYIAKGGNTSIYGTDPELLDDLSFRIQNTTNASSTMTATSTGTSSAASKVVTDVSFVKLNPDSFTALAGGIATVKPYVLDGYEGTEEPPPAPGVGGQGEGIVLHGGHGGRPGEGRPFPVVFRGGEDGGHGLQVADGPAKLLGGDLQLEVVPGLQEDALRLHEPLAHRPVGGLAEVAPLGVLHMGPAGEKADLHVGDGGARQHPHVGLLRQVGEDEPLPVPVQQVLRAPGGEDQPRPLVQGLQEQMDLGVVPQGLEVAYPLHGAGDGLPIEDPAGVHGDGHVEPVPDEALEDLDLDLAHEPGVDLLEAGVPEDVELGVLLL